LHHEKIIIYNFIIQAGCFLLSLLYNRVIGEQIFMILEPKTFRVYVSSTYSDLKNERNALHKRVFPRLRELCAKYGFRFQAVDLRWGVSRETAESQETFKLCLKEIEKCQRMTPRPNFIVLLGDKYGWEPLPEEIPADEFSKIRQVIKDNKKEFPDNELEVLEKNYREDKNAVPSVYELQPVYSGEKEAKSQKELLKTLRKTVNKLNLSEQEKLKYFASATHQEIEKGALKVEDAKEHVFSFCRNIEGVENLIKKSPKKIVSDFLDISKGEINIPAFYELVKIKKRIKEKIGQSNFFNYKTKWENGSITTEHLGNLCGDVYKSLSKIIEKEAGKIEYVDELEKEIDDHIAFGIDRAKFFVGRGKTLDIIKNYINYPDSYPKIIYGERGIGKSALMAKAAEEIQIEHPEAETILRFVGATPDSLDIKLLLKSLCVQIFKAFNFARMRRVSLSGVTGWDKSAQRKREEIIEEYKIPEEVEKLSKKFYEFIVKIPRRKRLFIFIDGIDKLPETTKEKYLNWILNEFPKNIKLIVSTTSVLPDGSQDKSYTTISRRLPSTCFSELKSMTPEEGERLLDVWLSKDAGRILQPEQRKKVIDKFKDNGKPLYLKLAYEEAKRWKSFTPEKEVKLSSDIPGIIHDLFERLSSDKNHGEMMVSRSLGYIAAGKKGLSEDELIDVLSEDEEFFKDFLKRAALKPPEKRLPFIVWSRLYFDLKPFIKEWIADRTYLMTFYFSSVFRIEISKRYLKWKNKILCHRNLAEYFENQDLFYIKGTQRIFNLRKLSELPYQQIYSRSWKKLYKTLTDIEFLEQKSTYLSVYELIDDYEQALKYMRKDDEFSKLYPVVKAFKTALDKASLRLKEKPELTFPEIYDGIKKYAEKDELLKQKIEKEKDKFRNTGYNKARIYFNKGFEYGQKDRYQEAIEEYKKAILMDPNHSSARFNLGLAYYKIGKYKKAIPEYEKLIEHEPLNSDAYFNLALVYYTMNRYDEAIRKYKKSIECNPNKADAYYNLGLAYFKNKQLKEAIIEYKKAIEIEPENEKTHYNLGIVYYDLGEFKKAVISYKEAIRIKPGYKSALYNLGLVYQKQNEFNEAIKVYEKVVEINPNSGNAHYDLGLVYEKEGNIEKAIYHLKRAEKLGYIQARPIIDDLNKKKQEKPERKSKENYTKILEKVIKKKTKKANISKIAKILTIIILPVLAYLWQHSIALAIFVFLVVGIFLISLNIVEDKGPMILTGILFASLSSFGLYLAYLLWGKMWLAVILGLVFGWFAMLVLGVFFTIKNRNK